jgi:hypothetical protein
MRDAVGGLGQIRQRLNGERSRTATQVRHHDNGGIRQTWQAPLEAGYAVCMAVAAGGRITLAGPGEVCAVTLLRAAWIRVGIPETALIRAAAAGYASSANICVQSVVGGCFGTEPQAACYGHSGDGLGSRAQGRGRQQQAGGGAGPPAGGTRHGTGHGPVPATRPGLDGWIAEGFLRAEARSDLAPACRRGGGEPTATRAATRILRHHRPELARFWVETLAGWLEEHVRTTLARQQGGAWQWEATVLAWLMEQAGISEMQVGSAGGRGDRELAVDLIAEAGFPAAALRQTPFRMWSMGARGCHPGVAMPGARAQNSDALGCTNRTIPEDAARALADLVLACQPAGHDVDMRVGGAVEGTWGPRAPALQDHRAWQRRPPARLRRRGGRRRDPRPRGEAQPRRPRGPGTREPGGGGQPLHARLRPRQDDHRRCGGAAYDIGRRPAQPGAARRHRRSRRLRWGTAGGPPGGGLGRQSTRTGGAQHRARPRRLSLRRRSRKQRGRTSPGRGRRRAAQRTRG